MWNVLKSTRSEKRGKQQLRSATKVCIWAKWPIGPALITVSVACISTTPHPRITPNVKFASTYLDYLYMSEERLCESKVSQYNVPSQGLNPDCLK